MNIYLSTTFDDMNIERKIIKEVANELNISITDLRDFKASEMEDLALDYVSRADGIICCLGTHYGDFITDQKKLVDLRGIILDNVTMSITELELIYASALNKDFSKCLFYFRNPIKNLPLEMIKSFEDFNPDLIAKMNSLKNRIAKMNVNLVEYDISYENDFVGYDFFREQVKKDLERINFTNKDADLFLANKALNFKAKEEIKKDLVDNINLSKLIFIKGNVGVGKSALVGYLSNYFSKYDLTLNISGMNTKYASDILYEINDYLLDLGFTPKEEYNHLTHLEAIRRQNTDMLFNLANDERDLYVFIDGLELMNIDEMRDLMGFLPYDFPDNVHFVVAISGDFKIPYVSLEYKIFTVPTMEDQEFVDTVIGLLSRHHHNLDVKKEMLMELGKKRWAHNPLYVDLVFHHLFLDFTKPFEDCQSFPDDIEKMGLLLLEKIGNPYALKLIANARNGISIDEICLIYDKLNLSYNRLDFYRLVNNLADFIYFDSNNRLHFSSYLFIKLLREKEVCTDLLMLGRNKIYYGMILDTKVDLDYDYYEMICDIFDASLMNNKYLMNYQLPLEVLLDCFDCDILRSEASKILPVVLNNPYDDERYSMLVGNLYYLLGQYDKASDYLPSGDMLGNCFVNLHQIDKASQAYLDPHMKGFCLYLIGQKEEALKVLDDSLMCKVDRAIINRKANEIKDVLDEVLALDKESPLLYYLDIIEKLYHELARVYASEKNELALDAFQEALKLAVKIGNYYNDPNLLRNISVIRNDLYKYYLGNNLSLAIDQKNLCLDMNIRLFRDFSLQNDLRNIVVDFTELIALFNKHNKELSFQYFNKGIGYANALYEKKISLDEFNILSNFYLSSLPILASNNKLEEVKSNYERLLSLNLFIYNNTQNPNALGLLTSAGDNLAGFYIKSDINKARSILNDVSKYVDKLSGGLVMEKANHFIIYADLEMASKHTDKALDNLLKALPILENTKASMPLINVYNRLISIYLSKENLDKALDYSLKALVLEKSINHPDLSKRYLSISSIYNRMGKKEEANKYMALAKALND